MGEKIPSSGAKRAKIKVASRSTPTRSSPSHGNKLPDSSFSKLLGRNQKVEETQEEPEDPDEE